MEELKDTDLQSCIKAGVPIAGRSFGDGLTWTFSGRTASWVLRYRIGGKQREITIGNYPDISITAAKKFARAKRVQVDIDVAAQKRKDRIQTAVVKSFQAIAEDYLERGAKDLGERTRQECSGVCTTQPEQMSLPLRSAL